MLRFVTGVLTSLVCSLACANVSIGQYDPGSGTETSTSDPISATYASGYILKPNVDSVIYVSPLATGNLANGTFYDGMSFSGSALCAGCNSGVALYLPALTLADSFVMTSASGQAIPFTLNVVMTPQFGLASSSVFSDVINENVILGGSFGANSTACFSVNGGCGAGGVSGPNNLPYTMTLSGTIISGGTLSFTSVTTGSSSFVIGPTSTVVNDSFDLDPTIQLTVPQGVTVSSASGVFPVTIAAVPEPGGLALMGLGFMVIGLGKRPRSKR